MSKRTVDKAAVLSLIRACKDNPKAHALQLPSLEVARLVPLGAWVLTRPELVEGAGHECSKTLRLTKRPPERILRLSRANLPVSSNA